MCVICGEYDGLAHHVDCLFKTYEQTSLPLICSIFDLHLLTEYLNNPYDFTYYVKQRIETWNFFKFTNEISILGYHLKNNLHHLQGYNVALIDDYYARMIDEDYMPYLYGLKDKLDLSLKWRSDFMNQFCSLLQDPKFINVFKEEDDLRNCSTLEIKLKYYALVEKIGFKSTELVTDTLIPKIHVPFFIAIRNGNCVGYYTAELIKDSSGFHKEGELEDRTIEFVLALQNLISKIKIDK